MLTVDRPSDPAAFVEEMGAFLGAREAEHNLILGLCSRLAVEPLLYGEEPYVAVVREGGRIVGGALRTPPFNLILTELEDPGAVGVLAADAFERFERLPGVLGPKAAAAGFAAAWGSLTGSDRRRVLANRIYQAEETELPPGVPGVLRPYADADHETTLTWLEAFLEEAVPDELHPEPPRTTLEHRLRDPDGGLVLWENGGRPVSLAGFGGPTPTGIRIGPVYTPPEHRRRGFGTAVTAALTRQLLDAGRRFCFLFTDLANPTSNAIYQRIGYRPVADVDQYAFD